MILIIGWISFGIYWLTQIPHFLQIGDSFNALFCLLGFFLFIYFAYHESLNIRWNEYLYSLNYIAGIVAVGGLFYYAIEKFEPLAKGLIYVVASHSVWLGNIFGVDASLGNFSYDTGMNEFHLQIDGTGVNGIPISIILACTGIQSMAIFIGILIATKPNRALWVPGTKRFLKEKTPKDIKSSTLSNKLWTWKKKRTKKVMNMSDTNRFIRVFLYTIPIIYILNIFRNALIMYGHVNSVLGPNTFDIAHNYLSKILSLGVLVIMAFIVFELLPECREGIIGLVDLQYRKQKGLVKDEFVDLDKVDELEKQKSEQTDKPVQTKKKPSKKKMATKKGKPKKK